MNIISAGRRARHGQLLSKISGSSARVGQSHIRALIRGSIIRGSAMNKSIIRTDGAASPLTVEAMAQTYRALQAQAPQPIAWGIPYRV